MSQKKQNNTRRETPDVADAKNPKETFLPGQIPVEESEGYIEAGPEGEERQPDPGLCGEGHQSRTCASEGT